MKKKILSFILSAAMAITGIGVGAGEPVTVYAGNETPTFQGIYISDTGELDLLNVDKSSLGVTEEDKTEYYKV